MSAATGTPVSPLNPCRTDWGIVRAHRHNVLLEGPSARTDAVLRELRPHIRQPIVWHQALEPLHLPNGETGALILKGVGALTADDQNRLLGWLVDTRLRTQIVSTTEYPLLPLVADGRFDDVLYYRLNVLLLHVGSWHWLDRHVDQAERTGIDGRSVVPA